jgi:hypothetical protein
MKFDIIPDEDALNLCAWCGGAIDEFTDVFAVGATARPHVDLHAYRGHCIQIDLISQEKSLNALVAAEDSDAKAEQKDLMFMVCSTACSAALKQVLQKEAMKSQLLADVSSHR